MGTAHLRNSRSSRPKHGASTLEGVIEAISDARCESEAVGGESKALSICRSGGTKISDILEFFLYLTWPRSTERRQSNPQSPTIQTTLFVAKVSLGI